MLEPRVIGFFVCGGGAGDVVEREGGRGGVEAGGAGEGGEVGAEEQRLLNVAYDRCGEVCAEYAKTFYMGTSFIWILDSASNVVTV